MKALIFWASYLYFPFVIACAALIWKGGRMVRLGALAALLPASILAYARFIEPQMLRVVETRIDLSNGGQVATLRIAVFADTHYGIFQNSIPLQRLLDRLSRENIDAVFIPGDFVYHISEEQIAPTFHALRRSPAPVFAVLGNHDVGFPGPDVSALLSEALTGAGVTNVENRAVVTKIGGIEVIVAGASDIWQERQEYVKLPNEVSAPVLFLAHNPDTAYDAPAGFHYDLMISGHTHGGQIRLPGLVQRVIPTDYPFDHGLHAVQRQGNMRKVFVTSGTGMVGLPMRFLMPPRIDILNLQIDED